MHTSPRSLRGFFDDYEVFLETGRTAARSRDRLNLRHIAIIGDNADILQGARVLDIASHDGRWSFAALRAGAHQVVAVEARPDLVEAASKTFKQLGAKPSSYDLVCGDVFEELIALSQDFDVVLCLGFLYHTARHLELLRACRALGEGHLIIDTMVDLRRTPVIRLGRERTTIPQNAISDAFTVGKKTLVGRPSRRAMELLLQASGFRIQRATDWSALLTKYPYAIGADDYRSGTRITLRCEAVKASVSSS
jgi:2-polyprenyl-3-methyl-5-hydroxy-6-metoxy-1,4-benzoquinol methylase